MHNSIYTQYTIDPAVQQGLIVPSLWGVVVNEQTNNQHACDIRNMPLKHCMLFNELIVIIMTIDDISCDGEP